VNVKRAEAVDRRPTTPLADTPSVTSVTTPTHAELRLSAAELLMLSRFVVAQNTNLKARMDRLRELGPLLDIPPQ
jgi:hypothetical protein